MSPCGVTIRCSQPRLEFKNKKGPDPAAPYYYENAEQVGFVGRCARVVPDMGFGPEDML